MKRMMCWFMGMVMGCAGQAQTSDEWFNQTSTRKRYNEEQISALQTFISVAGKGYSIAEAGLNEIKGIKSGEFDLHNSFYTSLASINPVVGKMAEVVEIIALQAAMVERTNAAMARYRGNGLMGTDEVTAMGQVFQAVVNGGTTDIAMLIQLITANKLQMTDEQRMGYIRGLDVAARERYELTAGFIDEADMSSLQRQAEAADVGAVKGLYGIP